MRVVSGSAKGIKLDTISGLKTRPTTDRVKEALFSMIQFDIAGAVVLDAFAGSGALGIEALSRAAQSVDFVDQSAACVKVIKQNLAKTHLKAGRVHRAQLEQFLMRNKGVRYDIVLLDPPYAENYVEKSINCLITNDNLNKNAIIVVEHNNVVPLAACYDKYERVKEKRYGNTYITIYRGDQ